MAGSLTLAVANAGGAVAWVVPTYKNARPVWRFAETAVLRLSDRTRVNKSERTIEFPTGGWLGIYTADNDVALRGEAFDLVIIDEAAQIAEETYTEVIWPTLADKDGQCMLISTPHGHNWFWKEWSSAKNDGKHSSAWTAPSNANPMPQIQRAYKLAKMRLPQNAFEQEWNARFLQDGGSVFRRVRECVKPFKRWPLKPYEGTFVAGLDFAQENDFTVMWVIDADKRVCVDKERFNKLDWRYQRERIKALWRKWDIEAIVAEHNSIGGPNIEQLAEDDVPIVPFTTTNATKAILIQDLIMAIENKQIAYPNDPILIGELEAFTSSRTKTGLISYAAPPGQHDDEVIALALALHACKGGVRLS